ncbi:universal stress protein [Halosolutus gelatinilyticus]|uniref:universal stress protein n=1 Tax=Halosolutus gelatinilyticus TaxID=2931975 RepID=UPI001FF16A52|nr:universal stress protein [Halosolutus gelatinilyticus]
MSRHVLVPIDRSEQSRNALDYALREYPDDRITVLHVIQFDRTSTYNDSGFPYTDEYVERVREKGREILDAARETAAERGVEVTVELARGRPARTITAYAEDNDLDHIVVGSHGRSGPSRVLLGSVAETVTRRSPVPVTTVR